MANWQGDDLPNRSSNCVVPISEFQSRILRLLAGQRRPDSYIAGGIAVNRDGPRRSRDIDIFHDNATGLAKTAEGDAAILRASGLEVDWVDDRSTGKRSAVVKGDGEQTILEWVADADFRYFPAQPDEMFGYVLHPVDLATNKASAAADRRVPRDIVDLVTIHENILPLGAVINAAVGRFPGMTPEEMLAEIVRHSRFTADEFRALATEAPVDPADLHRRIRAMIQDAEAFLAALPSDAIGVVFMEDGHAVQPDLTMLAQYHRHTGTSRGSWPSSPEISGAMLARHRTTD